MSEAPATSGSPARPGQPPADGPPQPGPPPWWRTLRAEPPFLMRIVLGIGFVGLVLAVWWGLTRGSDDPTKADDRPVSRAKLPSPGEVFVSSKRIGYDEAGAKLVVAHATLPELAERDLGAAITASLRRVLMGVLWASLLGIGLGVLAGSYRALAAALNPVVIFLRSIPMGALIPLTVAWFATGETQKEMFIFLAIVPFVFSDTVAAVSSVPQRYIETAETLGARPYQIIGRVLVPLALPDIVTSLRIQIGLALGYIMLAEAINAPDGIGALLNTGERQGLIEQNYLLLFILAALAFAIDFGLRFVQRGVFHYRKDL